jgi:hypothetical protein
MLSKYSGVPKNFYSPLEKDDMMMMDHVFSHVSARVFFIPIMWCSQNGLHKKI